MKRITKWASGAGRSLGLLLVFVVGIAPISIKARVADKPEVRRAVETWVRSVTANARPDAVIESLEPHRFAGETVAYIAHLSGGGFCLCGADDLVLPVYFYSPQGRYDPHNPNTQYILWEIGTRLKNLREGLQKGDPALHSYERTFADRKRLWQDLSAGRAPRRPAVPKGLFAEPDFMSLDLTSQWHQDSPYNDLCPELTPAVDEHTLVACDALAMAQIMYYWQWPNTGAGVHNVDYQYRWRNDWDEKDVKNDPGIPPDPVWTDRLEWVPNKAEKLRMKGYWDQSLYSQALEISTDPEYQTKLGELWDNLTPATTPCNVNFAAANYNWDIMDDAHADPPDAGDLEAAKLCFHAGIAANTSYGISSSMWSQSPIDSALVDHFRYDPDAKSAQRNLLKMTDEIQWLRPALQWGWDASGAGHIWVVYGYNKATDPDRQFLVNMGWGGAGDGWYSCDNIDYHISQEHCTGIAPESGVRFVGDENPGDGSPDNPFQDIEEAIAATPDSVTLIFKTGSVMPFSADTLVIDRPMVLKGRTVIGQ